STTPLHLRQNRTRCPSSSRRLPMRVGAPQSGQMIWTLDAFSAASRSTMPPLMFFWGLALVCFLMKFTPSTMTRPLRGSTRRTRPRLPRSRPVMTTTLSFFRIGDASRAMASEHLRCQRDDLHEPAIAQLARHGPEHAGPDRLVLIVDEHRRVAI